MILGRGRKNVFFLFFPKLGWGGCSSFLNTPRYVFLSWKPDFFFGEKIQKVSYMCHIQTAKILQFFVSKVHWLEKMHHRRCWQCGLSNYDESNKAFSFSSDNESKPFQINSATLHHLDHTKRTLNVNSTDQWKQVQLCIFPLPPGGVKRSYYKTKAITQKMK